MDSRSNSIGTGSDTASRVPTNHPRTTCPACQIKLGLLPPETLPSTFISTPGRAVHPREWQSYQIVPERKSNKPGFAFTPFAPYCPIHAQKDPVTPAVIGTSESVVRPQFDTRPYNAHAERERERELHVQQLQKHRERPRSTTALSLSQSPASTRRSSVSVPSSAIPTITKNYQTQTQTQTQTRIPAATTNIVNKSGSYSPRQTGLQSSLPSPATSPSSDKVKAKTALPVPLRSANKQISKSPSKLPGAAKSSLQSSSKLKQKPLLSSLIPVPNSAKLYSASSSSDLASIAHLPLTDGDSYESSRDNSNTREESDSVFGKIEDIVLPLGDTSLPTISAAESRELIQEDVKDSNESDTKSLENNPDSDLEKETAPESAKTVAEQELILPLEQEKSPISETNSTKFRDGPGNSNEYLDEADDANSVVSYDFQLGSDTTSITYGPVGNSLQKLQRSNVTAAAPQPTNQPIKRRQRKPIDMTNLTLLHHLLTTRLSDLQTHHAALLQTKRASFSFSGSSNLLASIAALAGTTATTPQETNTLLRSHHQTAYISSAREIVFLGRGIAKSWGPIARGCKDPILRNDLILSLQRIDTLSARMKGVLGSVARFGGGESSGGYNNGGSIDAEGVVLSSAAEVVKAAEGALRDLEAARLMVWEKDENEDTGVGKKKDEKPSDKKSVAEAEALAASIVDAAAREGGGIGVIAGGGGVSSGGILEQVAEEDEEEENSSTTVVSATAGASANEPIVFSGMEGMQEALKIALRAAGAVGE
ncbi:hypothetical protein HK100_011235 [Physocladia obscura]|uniref:Uncharacterized protein n=1 Tax=Physocladia obscura TaxID=109957 RepID=A0AAD5T4G7_9FUNG|nr:hypothetical protein HK100_011235 [Physocladia obscura]